MHKLTEEQILRVKKWIEELRSGKYQQGTGWLRAKNKGSVEERFCCLGVACILSDVSSTDKILNDGRHIFCYNKEVSALPREIQDYYGLMTMMGSLYDSREASLASLNDSGVTFERIADIIEENLLDNRNKLFEE